MSDIDFEPWVPLPPDPTADIVEVLRIVSEYLSAFSENYAGFNQLHQWVTALKAAFQNAPLSTSEKKLLLNLICHMKRQAQITGNISGTYEPPHTNNKISTNLKLGEEYNCRSVSFAVTGYIQHRAFNPHDDAALLGMFISVNLT